eukprot:g9821.t1
MEAAQEAVPMEVDQGQLETLGKMSTGDMEESSSSDSSEEAEDQACRPQRQLRRRSRSHSQAPGPEGTAADGEASSSSSSSSSSSVLRHAGLWNESTDEPYLPEDALLHVSLSNGDGITGKHHFEIHNISVTSNCLVPFGPLADAFHLFDAWDGLVINELAYSLRSRGYLERLDGAESVVEVWAWSADQVESPLQASFLGCLFRKIMILLSAVMSFCLISAITGLFIRIAVHGSAVYLDL